jgi:hypothetical protein
MIIKAVQLDLARQKENLDFTFSFIDFAKQCGYNTLVLYLEGIIKTKSFVRIRGQDTYEPDEIRKVVAYAAKNEMDVIPVVSSLGHVEMFLEHPEHAGMADLAGETRGRWPGKRLEMTCPSREETYQFFEHYFAEVAELFPGKYFHVGLDETWQIGMCDVCKKRFEEDGRGDLIYADHVRRIHDIVKIIGKTMMMWDDMFEIYPDAIHHIPNDIVLCGWYYDYFADRPQGHFANHVRRDVFGEYDRLGFQYLFCPRELSALNVLGITQYAMRYNPLGGLMTTWEKSSEFYAETYPVIALAGRLWNSPNAAFEKAFEESIHKTTGVKKAETLAALKTWFCHKRSSYRLSSAFARGEVASLEEFHGRTLETLLAVVEAEKTTQNDVLDDIAIAHREQLLNFRLRKAVYETILAKIEGNEPSGFSPLLEAEKNIRQQRLSQWKKFRSGISDEPLKKAFADTDRNFSELTKQIDSAETFLFVRFFLPDVWASPWTTLIVENDRGEKIIVADHSVLKPPIDELASYEFIFPFKMAGMPQALTLEVSGYGGEGISFVKLFAKHAVRYVPASIRNVSGQIYQPASILTDDLQWCYLGEPEVLRGFRSADSAKAIHRLTIDLAAEK